MLDFGEEPQPLVLGVQPVLAGEKDQDQEPSENLDDDNNTISAEPKKTIPPKHDEIIWAWKVRITLHIFLSSFLTTLFSK